MSMRSVLTELPGRHGKKWRAGEVLKLCDSRANSLSRSSYPTACASWLTGNSQSLWRSTFYAHWLHLGGFDPIVCQKKFSGFHRKVLHVSP